jgi:hypothetical protein
MAIEQINPDTLTTTAGGVFAVGIVSAALRSALKIVSPLLPFIVSLGVGILMAYLVAKLSTGLDWVMAFFNACLLYCGAMGLNETAAYLKETPPPAGRKFASEQRPPVLKSWFRD